MCEVRKDGDGAISVPVQFKINSAVLPRRFRAGLGRIADALREVPDSMLEISGHADVSGGDEINVPLSQRRAAVVFSALVEDHRIDPSRLRVVGYGSSRLCTPDAPRSAVNRRVSFRAL